MEVERRWESGGGEKVRATSGEVSGGGVVSLLRCYFSVGSSFSPGFARRGICRRAYLGRARNPCFRRALVRAC